MADREITLDQLFERQAASADAVLVTIEPTENDPDRVKMTPFLSGSGCQCSNALVLPKTSIESLSQTDEVHICCGHRLLVVEVKFTDPVLSDVFQQIVAAETTRVADRWRGLDMSMAMPVVDRSAPSTDPALLNMQSLMSGTVEDRVTGRVVGTADLSSTGGSNLELHCAEQRRRCLRGCGVPASHRCACECLSEESQCLGRDPIPCGGYPYPPQIRVGDVYYTRA